MRWWLRARLVLPLTCTFVVLQLVAVLVGSTRIPMLNLSLGTIMAPLAVLLPCAVAVGVVSVLDRGALIERSASRPIRGLDAILAIAWASTTLATAQIAIALGASNLSWCYARTTVGLVGIAMALTPRFGRNIAAFVPAAFVIVASLFGVDAARQVRWWAFPLAPAASTGAAAIAAVLLGVGVAVTLFGARRPATFA